ncbi:L-serine ammonia-lyase, iron-sulfur-dependent, subunit alpha [Kiloniella laminariae]|uniref:L-serine ammonia-lyase n=1 Tax=Kiloniella laminariae TaxID=454162 RepID=A0ABT4LJ66_9PROT|nr:L-serine ammonia-lyase, iron-sulfur-dependent, subunit alpha [Kiloniella laminariae]MCZ4280032.1 L-serine ammonia-lyase, iron-sulfur-dependent, subunit alpha [Kiloniella laminariae]
MNSYFPSILNDAIGPVMRGASSSHVAAAYRIGQLARDYMDGEFSSVLIEYDPNGSLEPTHESQGSDMGLFTGLMGWDITDDRMVEAGAHLEQQGIAVEIRITDYQASHANTYRLTLSNKKTGESCCLLAISIGGGIIEVIALNGVHLSLFGDYHETLFLCPAEELESAPDFKTRLEQNPVVDFVLVHPAGENYLVQVKGQAFISTDDLRAAAGKDIKVLNRKVLAPVLPLCSQRQLSLPFRDSEEMIAYNKDKDLPLWKLALIFESARGNVSEDTVFEKMRTIVQILEKSIAQGIAGTRYEDRMYPAQAPAFKEKVGSNAFLDLGLYNDAVLAVTALMDVKSSMGVIVAAPTAGSCGTLPGTCLGIATALNMGEDQKVRAMLAAGLIGVFIAGKATFSAELGGCQAETGSGSGMAAAALVTLLDGSFEQSLAAASMALQNTFGLICDPVANRVEAPCLGKNVMMAGNALSAANMALAGFDPLIPLDEVIVAMHKVGQSIHSDLRCTGKGGLATTPTAKALEHQLASKACGSCC